MQIVEKDLAARLAFFDTPHGRIRTPALLPVINPLMPKDLSKFKPQALMTNSYLTWRKKKEEAEKKGIHKIIGFDGPIMTDSGAFQLMRYGDVEISNEEVIVFQKTIGSDIATPLDIPGLGDKDTMEKNLETTIERAKQCKELTKGSKSLWIGPLQGGTFPDLREKSAQAMRALDFDVYAVGTVVPLMNDYRFSEALSALYHCKKELSLNKPVHFFGAGHPMLFSFAVALGADLFDSAAYSLFAKRGNYLTVSGTLDLKAMRELPCSCPVCTGRKPSELNEELLAEHNLYVSLEEMKRIREAIHENTLWELLEERANAHPLLLKAFKDFKTYNGFIESLDVLSKKRFFVTPHAKNRPEVFRHEQKKKIKTKKMLSLKPFDQVPQEIARIYPFGQRVTDKKESVPEVDYWEQADGISRYMYGVPLPKKIRIEKGKTGRIRRIYKKDTLLASFRASDGMIIPHALCKKIHSKKGFRVQVDDDVQEFAEKGKNVFAKFVVHCDPNIRAGMDVLIVNSKDKLLASGTAVLSAREMIDFDEGVAVETRLKASKL